MHQLRDLGIRDQKPAILDLAGRSNRGCCGDESLADLALLDRIDAVEGHALVHQGLDVLDHLGVLVFVPRDGQIAITVRRIDLCHDVNTFMKIAEVAPPSELKNAWRRGETAYYEYHCLQSHDSADAQLWYRSHQAVTVIAIVEPGYGRTATARLNNGEPRIYQIRFADGHIGDAFEDELLTDPRHFHPEYCPPPANERR